MNQGPHLPDHVLSRSCGHCRHDRLLRRSHFEIHVSSSANNLRWDSLAASVVEVSVVFSVVNIVTGSIWARIIWGIWWTWDYRLTSALVCVLIFSGYLMMRRAIDEPTQRARLSSALCIFGCVDVVIVWKSIEWFRNNHPGPVLSIRTGGGTMDPAMERMIYLSFSPSS